MLTPISGHENLSPGSNKKVLFDCSCGNQGIWKVWRYFKNNRDCGECNALNAEHWQNTKYNKLRLKTPEKLFKGTNKKLAWSCDCGGECVSRVIDVTRGFTKSCGNCNNIPEELVSKKKYNKLRLKIPKSLSPGSHEKLVWLCDCGNESEATVFNVLSGNTKSCGKCSLLTTEYLIDKVFGSLKLKSPGNYYPNTKKKLLWICDCGNEKSISFASVISGKTKSCGSCNRPNITYWTTKKFGRLRLKTPQDLHLNSHKSVEWICDCGKEVISRVNSVTQKKRTTCGNCIDAARNWYEKNELSLLALKTPIHPEDIPSGYFGTNEIISKVKYPFSADCGICGNTYGPSWQNVRRGISLTCGCTVSKISSSVKQINDYLSNLGEHPVLEYSLGGLDYDIAVPSKKLLIEFNGLRWHSQLISKTRDLKKHKNAVNNQWDLISIFEDEYYFHSELIHDLLKNRLHMSNNISLRPGKCTIRKIPSKAADPFYSKYHYIGACKAAINYAVYYGSTIVACASFKKPSRQTIKQQWELVRMVSHPFYRVHGIWSKILKLFTNDSSSKSIVSYSDNRLFTGSVYGKLGFKFSGDVPPDYYWVKGIRRYHKSALRKTEEEKLTGKTENKLRTDQGYRKIYDLGKKRWILG